MPYKLTIRDYAISVAWPSGHHYFDMEMFDDLADARDREKQLTLHYESSVKAGIARAKSIPKIHLWQRQPSYKTLTAPRAPRRVSLKPRKQGEVT
jgi:hypothetical protein